MKILVLNSDGPSSLQIRDEHVTKIREAAGDAEVVLLSGSEGLEEHLASAGVLVGWPRAMPPLSEAKRLAWVHSFSAGVERLLTPEVIRSPVMVSNSAGIHSIPIAEHVIAFLLMFTRKLHQSFAQQREKAWQKIETLTELRGKKILIVGLGHIGRETARLAACLGAEISAVDVAGKQKPEFVEELGTVSELQDFLSKADFVVLCLPHTKDTHHFMNRERLGFMQSHAVLVNIGRGGVVDERALIEALRGKKVGGAALDVTEQEPLPQDSPLWDMENVIITPHHSGWSEKYIDRAVDLFCENLKAYLKGELLPNLVDKEKGY